jgi:hypothetical protein
VELPRPYRLADKTLAALNRKTVQLFERTRRSLQIANFDELTVFRQFEALYKALNRENEGKFRELYQRRYREMYLYLKKSWPEDDDVEDLSEIYLANLLTEPNDITRYAYDAEVLRKRDRAIEGINSAPSRAEKDRELEKAMRYWSRQTGFYIDIIADEAARQAMEDCGVERVKWHTQGDEKVCDDCDARNGKVYKLSEVPDKEHPRCRCWLEPLL